MDADIGLVGLAVMGENLVLNMESKGFKVAVYNRTTSKVDDFISGRGKDKNITGAHSPEELVSQLKSPRKIMLMVKAGAAVDAVIDEFAPLLDKGDVLIDGGNSNYTDTVRRVNELKEKGIHFVGSGVSGGEEGALNGPSIMPGGSPEAWPLVKDIFQKISAQVDGQPCCEWMGEEGAGHFVKMVHNGIEYGDMQLIAEAYSIMKHQGMSNQEIHETFAEWNKGNLNSYLIEITRDIFGYKGEDGTEIVDVILDKAGQKGTGKWTAIEALDQGIPLTLISEAVFARALSSQKDERVEASKILEGKEIPSSDIPIEDIQKALFASKIISYAQGFALLKAAAAEYSWNLDYVNIAKIWRGGCIIRSGFLNDIMKAFEGKELNNLILDSFFKGKIDDSQGGWRHTIASAVQKGIPLPAMSSALAYYDGYRSENLPANLIQAQRDFFGAHTYNRKDKDGTFHTNWTGKGGSTTSGNYNA